MGHIDRLHAASHRLGGPDPLDAFLDTASAQTATATKTFTVPPLLGTGPSIGSHWVWAKYVTGKAVAGSSFVALAQSRVYVVVLPGAGTISMSALAQSQKVALAGGSFTPSALAQSRGSIS